MKARIPLTLAILCGCTHVSLSPPPGSQDASVPMAAQPLTPQGDLVRDDWMVVPARHGGHEVITRTQYLDDRAHNARPKMSSRSIVPPPLLTAREIDLSVGQVRSYKTIDEPMKAIRVTGTAAKAFWTTPYFIQRIEHGKFIDHPGSDVHVLGVEPGQSQLILDMTDGTSRTFDIVVKGPPGTAERT